MSGIIFHLSTSFFKSCFKLEILEIYHIFIGRFSTTFKRLVATDLVQPSIVKCYLSLVYVFRWGDNTSRDTLK